MILSYIGQPFAGQVSNLYVFGGPFTLSANFVGSYAPETQWRVNATADATFQVYKLSSGVSTSIGTVKIPGGGGAATYVGSGATFLGGDACYAVAPSPQDATLTDVAFLIDDGTSLAPPPIVTLVSVAVAPSAPSVAKGLTQAFVATGTYSDSSTQTLTHGVTWMSSNTAVATIASTGVASTLSVGASNITASYGVITSPTATLTVSAAVLASLSVTPINSTIAELATTQFAAAGIYTDGTSVDLTSTSTWASSNTAAATISSGGLATGVGAGFTTITATHSPFSGNTVLIGQGDTTFTFDGYGLLEGTFYSDDLYVNETLLPGELRLRTPFLTPTLEKYRQLCMGNASSTGTFTAKGRSVIIFTRLTDIQGLFANLLGKIYTNLDTGLEGRTRTIDMDTAITPLYALATTAMQEMASTYALPAAHQELLLTRLTSTSFNNRVSAACAVVYFTAILQAEKDGTLVLP